MKFKFEQLLTAARVLSTNLPVTISEDKTVITLTRGITSIDFVRGENVKLDLMMVVKFHPDGEKDTAIVCALDNAGTIPTLSVGIAVADTFTRLPNNQDSVDNQKALINDFSALFSRAAVK